MGCMASFGRSTAALDEPTSDLFEYRTAKLAGEELCKRLLEKYRHLTIIVDAAAADQDAADAHLSQSSG